MSEHETRKAEDILKALLSTAYVTTGAVPVICREGGFASMRLTGVITEENVIRVFAKHGISIPLEAVEAQEKA